jgi:hypothetical protein
MLAPLLLGLFACQDPAPPTPQPPVPAQAPAPAPVEAWDDRTAKEAIDAFGKAMKGTPSMSEKNKALEALAKGSNKLLVKPLAQVVETDKSVVIRKRAAELLAQQPVADANPVIRKLLKNPKVAVHAAVLAELVRGLSRCGYQSAQWADLADLFEKSYAADRVPLQEALLTLVETHKEKLAIPLLLRNLDEPVPADPNAGDNPPAEYWEARWKAWAIWRGKVKDTLFALTGQRFSTSAEAKAWLKQNPLK